MGRGRAGLGRDGTDLELDEGVSARGADVGEGEELLRKACRAAAGTFRANGEGGLERRAPWQTVGVGWGSPVDEAIAFIRSYCRSKQSGLGLNL